MKNNPIIAIDGHSSTGKSTYAKMLAHHFGWIHIDTGAMYRAVTLYGLRNFPTLNKINMESLIENLDKIHISFEENPQSQELETYLNGENVEAEIRGLEVADVVSEVAKEPLIRKYLVSQQREIAKNGGIVMDGRDIGTVVFPNADLKFFITASVEERARRRFNEFLNTDGSISFEEVKENIKHRDYIDSNRVTSPLKQAEDAILIDNTNYNKEETFQKILEIVKNKLQ